MSQNNTSKGDEDALASFTNFGADGMDADTANLFGSFTNDSMQTNSVFGQLSVNDLSGFGMDLSNIEMGNVDGGMDLSSIQLMNLDEIPGSGISQPMPTDAAQMMARLLSSAAPSSLPPATAQLGSQPAIASSSQPVSTAAEQPAQQLKSRSSSQSSSEMGDIPLAQLALLQQGPAQQLPQGMGMSQAAQPIPQAMNMSQPANGMPTGHPGIPLAVSMYSNPPAQSFATSNILGMSQPANLQALINPAMSMVANPPLQQQQIQGQPIAQQAVSMSTQSMGMARTEGALAPDPMPASTTIEGGTSGVESTVLSKTSLDSQLPEDLSLQLAKPESHLEVTPLKELEQIESRLCLLLSIASRAIRMLSGASAGGQMGESRNEQLEATVREFMEMVATVHADLRLQHKKLVARGIPIQIGAGYQNDTAGFERDLISWSDAADLLATALHSGLKLSDTTV